MGRRSRVGDNIWHPKSNKAFFFPFTPKKRTGGNSTWFSVTIGTTIIYRVPLWARVFSIHDTSYNNSSVIRTVLVASIRQPAHTSLNKSGTVWAHVTKRRIDFVLRITGSFRKQRQQEAPETSFHMSHFYFSVCLCLLITIDRATPAEEEHGYHVPYGYKMLLSLKKKKKCYFLPTCVYWSQGKTLIGLPGSHAYPLDQPPFVVRWFGQKWVIFSSFWPGVCVYS